MQPGLSPHVFHGQRQPRLVAADGFMLRAMIAEHPALKPGGCVCFEFGMGQGDAVCRLLEENDYTVLERKRDYNDRERAVLAQHSGKG